MRRNLRLHLVHLHHLVMNRLTLRSIQRVGLGLLHYSRRGAIALNGDGGNDQDYRNTNI